MKNYKLKIPIGELFKFLNIDNKLYDTLQPIDRKVGIKTPSGEYTPILSFVKKQGWIRQYNYEGGYINCDENHKVKQSDGSFKFISETDHVIINDKAVRLINSENRRYGDVYDIALNNPHEYVTSSGVISHNTTLAKLIAKNVEADYLLINASDENNVETVRNKIKNFASSKGFKPLKILILDECLDGNTLVTVLRSGSEIQLPIKDLNDKSDLVKSWNINENRVEWRPFYLWDKGIQDAYEIELENGEVVICTADHKWYVYDNNNIIVVKTHELENYKYILSP